MRHDGYRDWLSDKGAPGAAGRAVTASEPPLPSSARVRRARAADAWPSSGRSGPRTPSTRTAGAARRSLDDRQGAAAVTSDVRRNVEPQSQSLEGDLDMGGSGEPRPHSSPGSTPPRGPVHREPAPPSPASGAEGTSSGPRQESGDASRKAACPSDFLAEVTDIPQEMLASAGALEKDGELPIELREGDPAFIFDGQTLGWLAVNIEEVTECLRAGWRYLGIVVSNESSAAGPVILTKVLGMAPGT